MAIFVYDLASNDEVERCGARRAAAELVRSLISRAELRRRGDAVVETDNARAREARVPPFFSFFPSRLKVSVSEAIIIEGSSARQNENLQFAFLFSFCCATMSCADCGV